MASARSAALHALVALERGTADRLRTALDAARLVGREQALANELAHGVLRRERLLDHVLAPFAHRGLPKDPALRSALRLGVYQLLFVGGMPAHAAVHETVALVRENRGFANALLRRVADRIEARPAEPLRASTELSLSPTRCCVLAAPLPDDPVERLAVEHSLPSALLRRWVADFGLDGVAAIAAAASAVPGVFLRAVGGDRPALAAELVAAGVQVEAVEHPRLLRWCGGESPFGTAAYRRGGFVVQDPTAVAAAEAVPCGPGAVVVDLCAAPGTKTTLLAERVRPGGRVFAWDVAPDRRVRIGENVARLGLGDVVQVVGAAAELPPADAVLADVPCSNSGVLGRRVEVRRRLTPASLPPLVAVQRELLTQALALAKPGGAVVYSTCSIDRDENDGVVAAVLAGPAGAGWRMVESHRTLPLAGRHDGGYWALLRRQAVAGTLPTPGTAG